MLLSNNNHMNFLKVFICLIASSAVDNSVAWAQGSELVFKGHDKKVSIDEVAVSEGRSAVNFYDGTDLTEKEKSAWRLSNKVYTYPVDPVERLKPLLEIGDPFLGNGPLNPGIKLPTGQVIQPQFLLFGTFRTAFQSFQHTNGNNTVEWSNRLDLNGSLNLSGTERLVVSMRPLDNRSGHYTGYNFEPNNDDGWRDEANARLTKLYFEGDLGEIFPGLDPTDSHTFDIGFSIGRQHLQLQDGMLMNDIVDMVGFTRNSLAFSGVTNMRLTGFYSWNHINRGNNDFNYNNTHSADMFGLSAEADTALDNTMSLDVLYVKDNHDENAWYVGAGSTQRFGWWNSTFRVNASIPESKQSATVGNGVLLLSQLSRTLHNSDDIFHFNTFWSINHFTSAARGPDQGNPIANLGILFGPVGMGRYGVPLGYSIDNTIGTSIGYQKFLDGIDGQLIFELGARTSTDSNKNEAAIGLGARYQHTIGKRHVLRFDVCGADQEHLGFTYGVRTEWGIKF